MPIKILVLDDGELVATGTHKELYKTNEVYRDICLSQLSEKEVALPYEKHKTSHKIYKSV